MNYETFLDGVQEYNVLNEFQQDYVDLILKPRKVWENLKAISRKNVEHVVIEFLHRWKIRNTRRIDQEELRQTLRDLNECSKLFRQESLSDLDFLDEIKGAGYSFSSLIEKMYSQIRDVHGVGPTSASKILHGINPSVFMIWDEKERSGYGCAENSIGYLRFLFESQIILRSVVRSYQEKHKCNSEVAESRIIQQANTKRKMSLTKLLDQYNFMKFTRESELPDPHAEIFCICARECKL